jgi:phage gp36-like protein
MARFIIETDYGMQIKQEIIRLLTTNDLNWYNSPKLVRAEQTAIKQIKHWIGKRYDCSSIFDGDNPEHRDEYIITITIDIALYHLYSQTGMKDIPEHRQQRYQDVLDWLKEVGSGTITADLPAMTDGETGEEYSDFRFNSRTPENQKW